MGVERGGREGGGGGWGNVEWSSKDLQKWYLHVKANVKQ